MKIAKERNSTIQALHFHHSLFKDHDIAMKSDPVISVVSNLLFSHDIHAESAKENANAGDKIDVSI